jgi:hypothetical protein
MSFKPASAKPRSSGSSDHRRFLSSPTKVGYLWALEQPKLANCQAIDTRRRTFRQIADSRQCAGALLDRAYRVVKQRKTGAPDTIRTCDLCLRRATLYPAELRVRGGSFSRSAGDRQRPAWAGIEQNGRVGERDALFRRRSRVRTVSDVPERRVPSARRDHGAALSARSTILHPRFVAVAAPWQGRPSHTRFFEIGMMLTHAERSADPRSAAQPAVKPRSGLHPQFLPASRTVTRLLT